MLTGHSLINTVISQREGPSSIQNSQGIFLAKILKWLSKYHKLCFYGCQLTGSGEESLFERIELLSVSVNRYCHQSIPQCQQCRMWRVLLIPRSRFAVFLAASSHSSCHGQYKKQHVAYSYMNETATQLSICKSDFYLLSYIVKTFFLFVVVHQQLQVTKNMQCCFCCFV